MPRGDRTGPNGMGPMSGRGAGYCNGYPTPGFTNGGGGGRGFGYGFGGRGGGRGRGAGFARGPWAGGVVPMAPAPVAAPGQEIDDLRRQAEYLKGALADIEARLNGLDDQASDE